jgi:hypothetical protein
VNKTIAIASVTAATLVAAVVAFGPGTEVQASTPAAAAQKFGSACSERAWPFYDSGCVRDSRHANGQAATVRFVSFVKQ